MSRSFVAIDDPLHRLLRNITHRMPLVASGNLPDTLRVEYRLEERLLPDGYYSIALLHSLGGMPIKQVLDAVCAFGARERSRIPERVGYFDATRLDRRSMRDLRLRPAQSPLGMLSAELLSFGTGTLRARNDDPQDIFQKELWSRHGRIESRHEVIYASLRALHHRIPPVHGEPIGKETFDSTNVLYGDQVGELLQIWDRRADTEFLDRVTASLKLLRQTGVPVCHRATPLAARSVLDLHFQRQAIWKKPPENARALLRRIEYILERIVTDSWPTTASKPASKPHGGANTAEGWDGDETGYDGWLR